MKRSDLKQLDDFLAELAFENYKAEVGLQSADALRAEENVIHLIISKINELYPSSDEEKLIGNDTIKNTWKKRI